MLSSSTSRRIVTAVLVPAAVGPLSAATASAGDRDEVGRHCRRLLGRHAEQHRGLPVICAVELARTLESLVPRHGPSCPVPGPRPPGSQAARPP